MKAIQFTKEQIEARENGATQFIVPISETQIGFRQKYIAECMHCEEETIHSHFSEARFICLKCGKKEIKVLGHNERHLKIYKHFIAPLQKGDEFFIQEEFAELLGDIDDIDSETIYYRNDGEINDCMDSDYQPIATPWQPASQMQEHQSRHKDTCLGIEVKRVQDIHTAREMENILGTKFISKSGHICMEDFDILIAKFNELYKSYDYTFLITCKGIQQ